MTDPYISGNMFGWKPQVRIFHTPGIDGIPEADYNKELWADIPIVDLKLEYAPLGVPSPCSGHAVIPRTLNMFGYNAAMALAFMYAARCEAEGNHVNVRVKCYNIQYNVKAVEAKDEDEV